MHSPYRKGRKVGDRRALLNAAALQDHMARLVALPSGGTGPVSTTGVVVPKPGSSRRKQRQGSAARASSPLSGEDSQGSAVGEEEGDGDVQGKGHRLTLAQLYGLVAAPRSKLDEFEWMRAHAESMNRGDVKHGCSICYEPFRGEDRVLLSCSHTFHKHCINAFEKFSKQRCCPLCRTLQCVVAYTLTERHLPSLSPFPHPTPPSFDVRS